jgi:hypothetical protein
MSAEINGPKWKPAIGVAKYDPQNYKIKTETKLIIENKATIVTDWRRGKA